MTLPRGHPMLFFLLAGHALMDFALQGDAMAVCKCRRANHPLQQAVPWYYWMTAHALLHGLAVGAIVIWAGYAWGIGVTLAIAECVIHWCIDVAKCERLFSIHVDQGLHVLCKVLWWELLVNHVLDPMAGL